MLSFVMCCPNRVSNPQHALANSRWAYEEGPASVASVGCGGGGSGGGGGGGGSRLAEFCDAHGGDDPDLRGRALLRSGALKQASDAAAVLPAAQTACPDRDGPDLDHHFVAFAR